MLRQYGSRGTIATALLLIITIFALLNFLHSSGYGTSQQLDTKVEETGRLEQDTFATEDPAEALIDGAKAALEEDASKSEEEKQAEAQADTSTDQPTEEAAQSPNAPAPNKVVVMGKMTHEDTDWVHELNDWSNAVYCVDLNATTPCPTGHKTPTNKAKEAMPYLTYIIEHYAHLPDIMAFVHAHRNGMPAAWHNDAPHHDAVRMLRDLKTDTVAERGYVNLRCIPDIGCPDEVQPFRSPPIDDKHAEHAYPYFYAHFFDATFEEMKATISTVATPCCAQFAVSKEQVLKREVAFYERVRDYLENTHYDDDTSGRVMEYMWHIIFGRDAVHCDKLFECTASRNFGNTEHLLGLPTALVQVTKGPSKMFGANEKSREKGRQSKRLATSGFALRARTKIPSSHVPMHKHHAFDRRSGENGVFDILHGILAAEQTSSEYRKVKMWHSHRRFNRRHHSYFRTPYSPTPAFTTSGEIKIMNALAKLFATERHIDCALFSTADTIKSGLLFTFIIAVLLFFTLPFVYGLQHLLATDPDTGVRKQERKGLVAGVLVVFVLEVLLPLSTGPQGEWVWPFKACPHDWNLSMRDAAFAIVVGETYVLGAVEMLRRMGVTASMTAKLFAVVGVPLGLYLCFRG